jgi:hypothetical protein
MPQTVLRPAPALAQQPPAASGEAMVAVRAASQ